MLLQLGTDIDSQSVLEEGSGVPDGLLCLLGLLLGARVGKVEFCLAFGSCRQAQEGVSASQHLLLPDVTNLCPTEHSGALVQGQPGLLPSR